MIGVLLALRAVNCPLLAVGVVWLTIRLADIWPDLGRGRRLIMCGVVTLMIAGTIGSAIKYLAHAPVDVSAAITTTAATLILLGLWRSRRDHRG